MKTDNPESTMNKISEKNNPCLIAYLFICFHKPQEYLRLTKSRAFHMHYLGQYFTKASNVAYIETANTAANKKGSISGKGHCTQPKNIPVFIHALLFLIGIRIQLSRSSTGRYFSLVICCY